MKILDNLANYIQNLNKKVFERYLILTLLIIIFLGTLTVYQIYRKSSYLVQQIKNTEKLAQKSSKMVKDYEKLQQKESELQDLLKKNVAFDINSIFEQFCKEQNVTSEPWKPTEIPVEGNENFNEIILNATFKNQSTEKLLNMLNALDAKDKENMYLKDLSIKNNLNKTIDIEITLASMKYIKNL